MSKTELQLKSARQQLARAQAGLARERDKVRRVDTRRKIQLGGLIVKAALEEESAALLLGVLLETKEKLAGSHSEQHRKQWQSKGQQDFEKASEPGKQHLGAIANPV
jgi:hypothetical protein